MTMSRVGPLAALALLVASASAAADFGFAPALVAPAGPDPKLLAAQDVTGDGLPDVIVASGSLARVRVLVNDGRGGLSAPLLASLPMLPHDWALADFDGDGRADVATISGLATSTITVLLSDGTGHFTLAGSFSFSNFSNGVDQLAAADVDEDGFADLLAADNGRLRVFHGNGSGGFAEIAPFDLGLLFGDPLVVDANGDGHVDLLLVIFGFGFDWKVLLGNGHGTFHVAAAGGEGPCDTEFGPVPAVGELDGDHLSDVVVGYSDLCAITPTTDLLVGLSNGSSITGTYPADAVSVAGTHQMAIADFDGDGFGDLVGSVGADIWKTVFVSLGHGDGSFATAVQVPTGEAPDSVAAADFDGDGVPDVVTANRWSGTVSLLLNTSLPPGWSDAGSGLAGAAGVPSLTGSGALLAGSPVQLVLAGGAPSATAALILGLHAASAPFKGGVLVPSLDVLLPGLVLSPAGGLSLGGAWPAGIAAGTTIWWQAWIADPAGPQGFAASNALAAKAQAP
jgi:FG-GAP-like repeat